MKRIIILVITLSLVLMLSACKESERVPEELIIYTDDDNVEHQIPYIDIRQIGCTYFHKVYVRHGYDTIEMVEAIEPGELNCAEYIDNIRQDLPDTMIVLDTEDTVALYSFTYFNRDEITTHSFDDENMTITLNEYIHPYTTIEDYNTIKSTIEEALLDPE